LNFRRLSNSPIWWPSGGQLLVASGKQLREQYPKFLPDLWENLPRHLNLRVVRVDSGFCVGALFMLWETLKLKFVVAARLTRPLQKVHQKGDGVAGYRNRGGRSGRIGLSRGRVAGQCSAGGHSPPHRRQARAFGWKNVI
jgi:hypothetical protein